ncbi:MAG: Ig domain-containing protein [Intestinibacter sp.]
MNKNTTTINVGETETLVATIVPTNATNQNVTWGTDAPNIATVTNGVVEGKAVGTASISVETVDGSHTDTCNVTVQQNTTGTSKNIFDKDTMLANPAKGLNSKGIYATIYSSWIACEIPVKPNTQYSIKNVKVHLHLNTMADKMVILDF